MARPARETESLSMTERLGSVIDYLDLHWRDMHWPAFDPADVFVAGSGGLLVLASVKPGQIPDRRSQREISGARHGRTFSLPDEACN